MKKIDIFLAICSTICFVLLTHTAWTITKSTEKTTEQIKNKIPETIFVERNISPIPYKDLGIFTISHYCDCPICTKTAKGSRTATGTKPKEGRTIACDGRILKMGDVVYIQDLGVRICEDKGGAIKDKRIDIYYNSHNEALKRGIKKTKVYLLK